MIEEKAVDSFQNEEVGEVSIRYPKMSDAEDLLDYINSVIDEEVFALHEEKDMHPTRI